MSSAVIDFMEEQNSLWKCDPYNTSAQEDSQSLEDIMKALNEIWGSKENIYMLSMSVSFASRYPGGKHMHFASHTRSENVLNCKGFQRKAVSESVLELLKSVGKPLNLDITEEMIDACHRTGNLHGRDSNLQIGDSNIRILFAVDPQALQNAANFP
ncbi:hypothetical protein J6590_083320 [Homalodisca vitripennis]|nr:hypothetical protein J6590_083320 [Homalodisca vitripennis]